MTDEQIKQNAEECADGFIADAIFKRYLRDMYIEGAHSRDEEIKELKEMYHKMFCTLAKKIEQLLDPWISVKEQLPEKLENDCVSDYVLTRIDGPRHVWYLVNKYNYDIKAWEGCNSNTTYWMLIPELKKGK